MSIKIGMQRRFQFINRKRCTGLNRESKYPCKTVVALDSLGFKFEWKLIFIPVNCMLKFQNSTVKFA
jgi:hypothetical protein